MQTALDKTISNLALEGCSLKKIAGRLTDTQHCESYCAFLFSAGLDQTLFKYLAERFEQDLPLPWAYLFRLIKKYKLNIDTSGMTKVFLHRQEDPALLSNSRCLDSAELINLRSQYWEECWKQDPQLNIEKELQIVSSQKLLKKEKELIQSLIQMDSKNPLFQQQWQNYQCKQAKDVFDEYKNTHQDSLYALQNKTSKEEDKILQTLVKGLNRLAQKHSSKLINDMIVILSSTGHTRLAVEFLETHIDTDERKWIYLDLLLEDNQFLKCLNFVENAFLQINPQSETAFALNYAKAQAYYGLKEYDKAKTILKDLIALRPQYRSAKTLLSQWQSEEKL